MTVDWHSDQLTGSNCGGRNCAACAAADAIAAAGGPHLTGDQIRKLSGVSCTPGVHSASGGLFISDVERVCRHYDVEVDYGRPTAGGNPVPWTAAQGARKLRSGFGMIALGDYDGLPVKDRAPGSHFLGDHSCFVHDLRADGTVCFHDPLRKKPIRITWASFVKYWQKKGSDVRGLAGFVKLAIPPAVVLKGLVAEVRALRKAHRVKARLYRLAHRIPKTETVAQRIARLAAEAAALR